MSRSIRAVLLAAGLSWLVCVGIALATATEKADDQRAKSEYLMKKFVISGGGAPGSADGRLANGTIGQSTPIGVGTDGTRWLYAGFWFSQDLLVSVTPDILRTELRQNYPNPFNPLTNIRYAVAEESLVEAAVYDVRGRLVRTLVHQVQPAGMHKVVWEGKDQAGRQVASGLYFCRMKTGDYTAVKKMLLMK